MSEGSRNVEGSMQAVIMAGGEGSRLRPLTSNMPKPMLPVANRPLMEHILLLLRRHGFTDVVATVQFLSSVIRNYFGDGSDLGVSLAYSNEEVPLGTAGSVLNAQDLLAGPFLVISGDALTDIDLAEVVRWHRAKGAAATMVLKRMKDPLEFGIVMTAEDGRIERFLEKPTWGQVFTDTINTGMYVLEPEVLDLIPPDQPYDFSSELFPLMVDKGLPLFGFVTDAYWADVGNSEAFLAAQQDALNGRVALDIPGFELRPSVWVGEDVSVDASARLRPPVVIGDNTRVKAGASVGPGTVVGLNATVSEDARLVGGVVMDRAHIAPGALLRGGVVGRGASIARGATVEEGAILGDETTVGPDALIKPRVKVYPSRAVEAGAIVTHSVILEKKASRGLFGARGVSGIVNVGMTPVIAVRLGMAYGTSLKRGSVVAAGRDASRAARTLKRAFIAGLNATGVTCQDLELMPMPLTRFTVRNRQAAGGLSVRTSPGHPESVELRLFESDGTDLSEAMQRKIERIFFREDYRRTGAANIGELEFPPHAPEQYTSGLLGAIDVEAVRAFGPKVVVDYAFGPASLVGPAILGRLGSDVLAVNGFADENRPVLVAEDVDRLLAQLADLVRNSGSDLGVLLEPGGEVAHLVDDHGRVVDPQAALLAFTEYESARGAARIAVPVSAPSACEGLASRHGARLLSAPTGLPALMAGARAPGVGLAGDAEGTLIWPSFMPAPDGLMACCKALELVATSGRSLAGTVNDLPAVHLTRRSVRTPWASKGTVMRRVASSAAPGSTTLLDGVKVRADDGWALVVPSTDEPLTRVWAEAGSAAAAAVLAERYVGLVEAAVAGDVDEET